MIVFYAGRVELRFGFWFFAVIACFMLVGRAAFLWYMLLPVLIHELGHLIALLACGGGVQRVTFTAFSLDIRTKGTEGFGYGRELLVAAAGVAANLLAAAALYRFAFQSMRTMFLIAANMAVALFNLLPVGNLDGGGLLRLLAEHAGGVAFSWKISQAVSFFALVPLFAAALFVLGQGGNLTLLVTCSYLALVVIRQM